MTSILALDPGESTGWAFRSMDGRLFAGTLGRDHRAVAELITDFMPDVLVLERFNLYPGKAQALSWNSFYPVEVIGVIKYICMQKAIPIAEQAPSIKKYAGGFGEDWTCFVQECKQSKQKVTEHMKDAYQHLRYYERFGQKK